MRAGLVYRSGRIADLTGADRARLVAVGVSDIFDLRTPAVAGRAPDPRVKGARYHLVNLFAVESTPFRPVATAAAARAERIRMNRAFVSDPKQRARTAVVLRGIAEADGPVIIHCTEGKDRTGWVSAVLQLVAGADRDAVMADYLASNSRRRKLIDAQVALVRRQDGATQAEIARIRLQVDRAYLQAGLDELKDRYGDLGGYLTEGLGLSRNTLAALRARLRG
jgi:protein-tyrosine phosphatase